jgi:hypothetical protein
MDTKRTCAALAALFVIAFSPQAQSQAGGGISLAIEKHAILTQQGIVIFRVRITCGPFEGVEEFQEGFAGGSQERTGAESESGIDGMVVCDGVQRTHTVQLTSFGPPFRHGPANANASVILCTLVGEEQVCFSGSTARRIIIRGGPFRQAA